MSTPIDTIYAKDGQVTIKGSRDDNISILGLNSGNGGTHFNNGAQIAFGYNGSDIYQHFIHTRHNNSNEKNAIDFYVCNGTENNSVTSGSVHTMSLVSGNVGIGMTNPSNKLTISGTNNDNISILGLNSGNDGSQFKNGAQIAFGYNGTSTYQHFIHTRHNTNPNNGNAIDFYVCNGTENNSVTSGSVHTMSLVSGNVGIGTTNPTEMLEVRDGNFSFQKNGSSVLNSDIGGIKFKHNAGGIIANLCEIVGVGDTNGYVSSGSAYSQSGRLEFRTLSSTTGNSSSNFVPSTRMTIDSNGNVGISTTSPLCKFYVNHPDNWAKNYYAHSDDLDPNKFIASFRPPNNNEDAYISIRASGEQNNAGIFFGSPAYYYSPNKCAIISEGGRGHSRCKLHFCFGYQTSNHAGQANIAGTGGVSRMCIDYNGNVGIGTTNPNSDTKLDVNGRIMISSTNSGIWFGNGDNNTFFGELYGDSNPYTLAFYRGGWRGPYFRSDTGRIGIGTTNPVCPLHVKGHIHQTIVARGYLNLYGNTGSGAGTAQDLIAIKSEKDIWIDGGNLLVSSDERIKKDIEEVPDNLSLEMVRNIPCKYYKYIDESRNIKNNNRKVIGFIAQEVKEKFPLAVDLVNDFEPNENRLLENITWEKIIDNSNNVCKYKLTSDLKDVSGIKYKFYVVNDLSGNESEIDKEVIGNSDNSFTFDQSYNHIFCYGKEVDDFHTLDKQKLFTLNFSATQEIDRIQQQQLLDISGNSLAIDINKNELELLKLENQELTNKVTSLETELNNLKTLVESLVNNN